MWLLEERKIFLPSSTAPFLVRKECLCLEFVTLTLNSYDLIIIENYYCQYCQAT